MSEVREKEKIGKGLILGCLTLVIIFVGGGALLLGYLLNLGDKAQQSGKTLDVVTTGSVAVLTNDALLAVSKEAEKRMSDGAGDGTTVNAMIIAGELTPIKKGTEVIVIDRGLSSSEVEVVSTGSRGFVPTSYLKKK